MTKDKALNYVLFAVEQSIRNGSCYWEIEDAFSDYESISKEALAQPAKEWVGLSDDEIKILDTGIEQDVPLDVGKVLFAKAIEQALKEKNEK